MLLLSIGVLVGVALALIVSLVAPRSKPRADEGVTLLPWNSDHKQLRVEYHQSVDRSLPPGR
jgi:uncharacterized membrane protein YgaE (UPF0421/DUF939 family)